MERTNNRFSPKEIAKINNIFYRNNISLSFESIDDYYNCFSELSKTMFDIRKKNLLKQIKCKLINEYYYDCGNIVITKSLLYYYDSVLLHDNKKIHQQMTIIRNFFHFNFDHYTIFDVDSFFGVSYDSSLKVNQGYYYSLMPGLISQMSSDSFSDLINVFKLSEVATKSLNIFKEKCEIFELYYFSFDYSNSVRNIGFLVEKSDVVIDSFSSSYLNYSKLNIILNFLKNSYEETAIGVQYGVFSDFFSIEIRATIDQLEHYLKLLHAEKVFNSMDFFDKVLRNNKDKDSYVLKFKWSSKNKLDIKFYTVEYNHEFLDGDEGINRILSKIHDS